MTATAATISRQFSRQRALIIRKVVLKTPALSALVIALSDRRPQLCVKPCPFAQPAAAQLLLAIEHPASAAAATCRSLNNDEVWNTYLNGQLIGQDTIYGSYCYCGGQYILGNTFTFTDSFAPIVGNGTYTLEFYLVGGG